MAAQHISWLKAMQWKLSRKIKDGALSNLIFYKAVWWLQSNFCATLGQINIFYTTT
jgi:hypothetical protein